MNAIERSIRAAIDWAARGEFGYVQTIEFTNTEAWIQCSWDSINLAFPRGEAPEVVLREIGLELPNSVSLAEWKPNEYLTFDHAAEQLHELASFVEVYAKRILCVSLDDNEYTLLEHF